MVRTGQPGGSVSGVRPLLTRGRRLRPINLKVSEKPFDVVVRARTNERQSTLDQGENQTEVEAYASLPDSSPVYLAQAETRVSMDIAHRFRNRQHRVKDAITLGRREGTDIALKALCEDDPHQALADRLAEAGLLTPALLSARTAISTDLKVAETFFPRSSSRLRQRRSACASVMWVDNSTSRAEMGTMVATCCDRRISTTCSPRAAALMSSLSRVLASRIVTACIPWTMPSKRDPVKGLC